MREEELAQKHNRRVPFRCGVRMAGTRRNQVELMLSRPSLRVNINLLFSIPYGRFLTTNGLCLTMIPVTFICDPAHVGFGLRIKRTPTLVLRMRLQIFLRSPHHVALSFVREPFQHFL